MMIDREVEWISYPADLYFSKDLSFQEKAFLIEFKSLAKREPWRGCWAQNRHFADQFDLSLSRVSEVINGLVSRGLVSVQMLREGKQIVERRIFLTDLALAFWTGVPPSEKAGNPHGIGDEPPSEKAMDNSTKANNTSEEKNMIESDLFANVPEPIKLPVPHQTATETTATEFQAFWKAYPRKTGKDTASKAFIKARRTATAEAIMQSLAIQCEVWAMRQTELQFTPHAATWLNQSRFNDDLTGELSDASRPIARPGRQGPTDALRSFAEAAVSVSHGFRERDTGLGDFEDGPPGYPDY
jgi:DNA-binding MarR family transcriptional regulator